MKQLMIMLLACVLLLAGGCQNKNAAIEEAKEKLIDHCQNLPTSMYTSDEEIYLFDVTGDGTDDLCTDAFFGSGMPRVSIVVYDYINDILYTLDGFPDNYRLEGIEKGRLVVRKYQEDEEEYGTVKFENDTIVFIAD